jgi:hypothetical protein
MTDHIPYSTGYQAKDKRYKDEIKYVRIFDMLLFGFAPDKKTAEKKAQYGKNSECSDDKWSKGKKYGKQISCRL